MVLQLYDSDNNALTPSVDAMAAHFTDLETPMSENIPRADRGSLLLREAIIYAEKSTLYDDRNLCQKDRLNSKFGRDRFMRAALTKLESLVSDIPDNPHLPKEVQTSYKIEQSIGLRYTQIQETLNEQKAGFIDFFPTRFVIPLRDNHVTQLQSRMLEEITDVWSDGLMKYFENKGANASFIEKNKLTKKAIEKLFQSYVEKKLQLVETEFEGDDFVKEPSLH